MNFGDLNEIITSIKKFLKKELKDVDINNLDKDKILEVKKNVYPKIIKKYEKADYELFSDICDRFFKPKYTFNDKLTSVDNIEFCIWIYQQLLFRQYL